DPDEGRRANRGSQRPELVCDERRLRAFRREARVARLPPAGARGRGERAARPVHGRSLPRDGRREGQSLAVRPGQHPGPQLNILVCVKRVPETGARITLTPDAQAIDTALLGFTISPHEECAVEEALRIVEQHGGSTKVLTLGPAG